MHSLKGEICALGAALAWAFALVLFKRSGERVGPVALNLFKNVVALLLLGATLLVAPAEGGNATPYSGRDVQILILSGIVGITLADTAFLAALNRIGVGLISIVDCLYSPFTIFFAWLLLGERLSWVHYLGGVLILGGVLVSSRHPPPPGRTRGQLAAGVALAVLAMALLGFGIVIAKPVIERFPLFEATAIRLLAGTVALTLLTLASPKRAEYWSVFRPSRVWWQSIPASVLGAYLSLVLWIAGFKYTEVSVAAILNQTSVVFAFVLAALVLHESFGRRKLVAVAMAIAGVLVITLGRA